MMEYIKGKKWRRRIKVISENKCVIQYAHNHFIGRLLLGWWSYPSTYTVAAAKVAIQEMTEEDGDTKILKLDKEDFNYDHVSGIITQKKINHINPDK